MPAQKRFLSQVMQGRVPQTLWFYDEVGHTQEAKKELLDHVHFGHTDNVLDTVKPTRLIRRMLQLATKVKEKELVLDFFAGSGSTAHAVLAQNVDDGGDRRFIAVQLPEPLPVPEPRLRTIADIAKGRIATVVERLERIESALDPENRSRPDLGFAVFKLAESNFIPWHSDTPKDATGLAAQLALHVDHRRSERSADDLLFEILLKSGLPLGTPIEKLPIGEKTVYSAGGGNFLICLERPLTLEVIRAMADRTPERVVCLDEGFGGNDQLKANAVQIFKTKGVTSLKMV